MPFHVCDGAMLSCTMGATPSALGVLPDKQCNTSNKPAANIMDHKPVVNIKPFGLCKSPLNPATATATTAALGVLTPAPCTPNTLAPWIAGSPTVMLKFMPALNKSSTLLCVALGTISITSEGETSEQIP